MLPPRAQDLATHQEQKCARCGGVPHVREDGAAETAWGFPLCGECWRVLRADKSYPSASKLQDKGLSSAEVCDTLRRWVAEWVRAKARAA